MRPRLLPVALSFLACSALAPGPAAADHHKPAVEQCLRKGGDLLTCSCLNGGPCEGALFTVACGHGCDNLGEVDQGAPVDVSIDFYDAGGKLVYRDDAAFAIARNGHDGGVVLMATGNLEKAEFTQWFRNPKSPLVSDPGLVLKVHNLDGKGKRRLVVSGLNIAYAHALYADYCGNAQQVESQLSMEDEMARALAAEAALSAEIQQEIADRSAADQTLGSTISNVDAAWQAALRQESEDRRVGEAAMQASFNSLSALLTQEAADRQGGDAALQASVSTLTANLNAEIARAQAAEAAITASVNVVAGDLAAEIARAQAAEAALSTTVGTLDAALAAEVARAQGAETTLLATLNATSTSLAGETARAQAAEAALSGGINALAASLSSETSARTSADQALINAVNGVQNGLAIYQTTLASAGVANNPQNPVDWTQIKNIPPALLGGGAAVTTLNGLTDAAQSFAIGGAGLAPSWSSAAGVHTLNLPLASASATGVISGASDLFIQNQIAAAQLAQLHIRSSDFTRTARVENSGAFGYAVQGLNTAATGGNSGGAFFGSTGQAGGLAFRGQNTNAGGTAVSGAGQGVPGDIPVTGAGGAFSGYDIGVFAYASTSGVGQALYTKLDGNVTRVNYYDGITQYKIQGVGTVSTLVKDTNGRTVTMHAPETPEIYLQDFGAGRLEDGRAHIELDPTFAKNVVVSPEHPMRVFIQLEDNEDIAGVVVKNKTAHGFDVVELRGGRSSTPFQWQVTCNRADEVYESGRVSRNADRRFEPALDPVPQAPPGATGAPQANAHPPWRTKGPVEGVFGRVLSAIAGPRAASR